MDKRLWRWIGTSFRRSEPTRGDLEWIEKNEALSEAPDVLVLPPLWDHHGHAVTLGASFEQADLKKCRTLEAVLRQIQARAEGAGEDEWILATGWDQNLWGGDYPHRDDLDAVCKCPALLHRIDLHAAWANSEALRRAGVTDQEPDPPGGRFLRAGGRLTGILLESAIERVVRAIPQARPEDLRRQVCRGLEHLRGLGLSGICEMGMNPPRLETFRDLDREGRLPIPVEGYLWCDLPNWQELPRHEGPAFRVAGIKIYLDGALGSRGAALVDEYSDDPGNRGILIVDRKQLERLLKMARACGLTAAIHSIGDRALRTALDCIEYLDQAPPVRLEHAQVVPPGEMIRLRRTGAAVCIQPHFALSDGDWAGSRLGPRLAWAYRLGSFFDEGIPVLIGTDFPIEDPDPRKSLFASLSRPDPGEAVSLARAFASYSPPSWAAMGDRRTWAAGEPWFEDSPPERILHWRLVPWNREKT